MSDLPGRFDIHGTAAIVTGAASGIGRAIALDLAGAGSKVLIADTAMDRAEEVAREARQLGGTALPVTTDVTDRGQVEHMVGRAVEAFGGVDILVNSAGIMGTYSFMEMKEPDVDRTLAVNVKGIIHCSQVVAKHMIDQKSGRIVNIGSSLSSRASVCNLSGGAADYCASKAAVQALTRSMAAELAPYGITVNAVAPGPTNTPMHTGYFDAVVACYQGSVPLGRLAEPEDIAGVVLFLVTDAARFVTGQTIHVNGGQLMVD